jgi:hypothetical protein
VHAGKYATILGGGDGLFKPFGKKNTEKGRIK